MQGHTMKILMIMDPPKTLTPDMDTSLLIAKEFCSRGHDVYYTEPQKTWLEDNISFCESRKFEYTGGDVQSSLMGKISDEIDNFDIVLMRKDPPVDDLYIGTTYILDYVRIPVINSPDSLRNINEKTIIGKWPDFTPRSFIFGNSEQVISFVRKHNTKAWVIKPLNMFNGMDIFKIWEDYENLEHIVKHMFRKNSFVVLQEFIDKVSHGDKKIFLLGDEILGAMNRVPSEGDFRANIHLGATPEKCILSKEEKHISKIVGEYLISKGVHLSCLDIIDNKLTEVNVTSPSGIPEINRVNKSSLEIKIVDYLEKFKTQD